jgi:hypothetical protein
VTFSGLDSGRKTHWFGQDVPAKDISAGVQGFWAHYWGALLGLPLFLLPGPQR